MNTNIDNKIYDQSSSIRWLWGLVAALVGVNKTFDESHEQNQKSFIYFFNKYKDKEGW